MASFFDDENKITVSAIVGENGSGKSSLLKLILKAVYHDGFGKIEGSLDYFVLIEIDGSFYGLGGLNKLVLFNGEILEVHQFQSSSFMLYFNYMLDSLQDNQSETWIDQIYHRSDDYRVPILLEPYKKNSVIDIGNIEYLTRQRMLLHKELFKGNDVLKDIFRAVKVKLSIDTAKILNLLKEEVSGKYTDHMKMHYKDVFKDLVKGISRLSEFEDAFSSVQRRKVGDNERRKIKGALTRRINRHKKQLEKKIYALPQMAINHLYIANKIDRYFENSDRTGMTRYGFNQYKNEISVKISDQSHSTLKVRNALNYQTYILNNKQVEFLEGEAVIDIDSEILNIVPSWLNVEFINENGASFSTLSSGEKSIYTLISTILYQINNIKSRVNLNEGSYKNIILLLDETDLGLHPKWQREYIYNIVNSIKKSATGINVHIICTSHSPFIVSDLPKDNILFLKNGAESKLNNYELTFAENIHTLLNDSFFMQDHMMMGKFAETKIEEIFDFFNRVKEPKLNNYQLKSEYLEKRSYFKYIGDIIGDDYLSVAIRNSIQELDSYFKIDTNQDRFEKISRALEQNPSLYEKWLSDINDD